MLLFWFCFWFWFCFMFFFFILIVLHPLVSPSSSPQDPSSKIFLSKPSPSSIGHGTIVGQMEVLSISALYAFKKSFLECTLISSAQHYASRLQLTYEGTEDGWLETCMYVIGIRKVVEPNLMGDLRDRKGQINTGMCGKTWKAG